MLVAVCVPLLVGELVPGGVTVAVEDDDGVVDAVAVCEPDHEVDGVVLGVRVDDAVTVGVPVRDPELLGVGGGETLRLRVLGGLSVALGLGGSGLLDCDGCAAVFPAKLHATASSSSVRAHFGRAQCGAARAGA